MWVFHCCWRWSVSGVYRAATKPVSPRLVGGAGSPRCPFLPRRRGNAKWWREPEPLFRKVKRGAVLACLLSHAYSIRPGPGPYGKEEGDSSPLFNIPLQAWLYLSCFPPRRRGGGGREGDGLKFLYICISSTSSAEQATLFPPSLAPRWGAAPGGLDVLQKESPSPSGAVLPRVLLPLCHHRCFWLRLDRAISSLLPALTTSPLLS